MNRVPRGVGVEEGGVGDGGEGPYDDGSSDHKRLVRLLKLI